MSKSLFVIMSFFIAAQGARATVATGVYKGLDQDQKECVVEVLKVTGEQEHALNQSILVKHSFLPTENMTLRPKLLLESKTQTIAFKRSYFEGAKAVQGSLIAAVFDESKAEFSFFQNVELVDHRVQTQSVCTGLTLESN